MTEHVYQPGDRVDIVIQGAKVVSQGPDAVTFTVDGITQESFTLPTADDDGAGLATVTLSAALPQVRAGDVWRTRRGSHLFFATQYDDGAVCLITPDHRAFSVWEVLRDCGPMDLVVHQPYGQDLDVDDRPAMFDLPDPDPAPAGDVVAEEEPPVYREVLGPLGPANPAEPWDFYGPAGRPADDDAVAVGIAPVVPIVPGATEPAEAEEAAR